MMFFVAGYGVRTWRGHQYSLALFPLWIRAFVTAIGNVVFGRTLGFVVTAKDAGRADISVALRQAAAVRHRPAVVAAVVGVVREVLGFAPNTWGTAVNLAWVGYDLVALSVIIEAALFRGSPTSKEKAS